MRILSITAVKAELKNRSKETNRKPFENFFKNVGLSMILYTIIRKEFNGRKPAQRTHRTMIRLSEMDF